MAEKHRAAGSKTLAKGLMLLEEVAGAEGSEGSTLTEISGRLGWNVSTTYRLLATLQEYRYVQRDPVTERYRLGARTLELSARFLSGIELRSQASPFLNALMLQSGFATHLVIYEERTGDVVYIDKVDAPQAVRMYTYIGIRFPANTTAAGKAILAYLPEERVERFVARGLRKRTANSISSVAALRRDLSVIRELGYASDKEENVETIHCVAAPVFDHRGEVIASISVSASTAQLPVEDFADLGSMVKEAAGRISASIGYQGSDL